MAVISGKDGNATVDGSPFTELQDWTLNLISENKPRHTNDCAGTRKRTAGVKDWNGTANTKDLPPFDEGDTFAGIFYTNQDIYTGNAIVDQITPVVNVDTGDEVAWAISFSANSAIAKTTGSAP